MIDKTSQELRAEGEKLIRLADERRKVELAAVITSIKDQVQKHDLKPEDIFPGITKNHSKVTARVRREPMYRGPKGQLWGGGSGRVPDWAREIMAAGESLEKYLIKK